MYGIISSETKGSHIFFQLPESYNPHNQAERRLTVESTISGENMVSDFGFRDSDRLLLIPDVVLEENDFSLLSSWLEDTENEYQFADGRNLYRVVVARLSARPAEAGEHDTDVELRVVEKII